MLPKVLSSSKALIDINFYYSVYKCAEMSTYVREGEKQTPKLGYREYLDGEDASGCK